MKRLFLLFSMLIFIKIFSQEITYDVAEKKPFQPMFSLGSSYYNSHGDIQGPNGNYLLGNMGINTGIRINISNNMDLSFLFSSNAKLYERSSSGSFETDLNSIGFNLDYNFNNILKGTKLTPFATSGLQWINYKTTINENTLTQKSGMNIPIGLGVSLNVSERIRFDIGMNFHVSFSDLDQATSLSNNDNFSVASFTLHYDLFSKKEDEYNAYDEESYRKVNFKAIDAQDSDNDGVVDILDDCPGTPKGQKVDENGCPYDDDNDGVPNHKDKQKNTKPNAIVNSDGIELSDEELRSMYPDYDIASKEYAKFYNDAEIQMDDYKTVNTYLISEINKFNNSDDDQKNIRSKIYRIQIGKFKDDVPSYLIDLFLSFEDLRSLPTEDGSFIYTIGEYDIVDDAERFMIEELRKYRDLDTKIILDSNGVISEYIPFYKKEISVMDTSNNNDSVVNDSINDSDISNDTLNKSIEQVLFRVQVGAYEKKLSYDIYKDLDVIAIPNNNITRYYIGSFNNLAEALTKRNELRKVNDFRDAFIVKFENGKRVPILLKNPRKQNENKQKDKSVNDIQPTENENKIRFHVQIGIFGNEPDNKLSKDINNLGEVNKVKVKDGVYKYVIGQYKLLSEAQTKLKDAKKYGFSDAFIYAENNGDRITIREAIRIINQ